MTTPTTDAARVSGTIKALEWQRSFGTIQFADAMGWRYMIGSDSDGICHSWRESVPHRKKRADSESAAKAAAQADYEARILSEFQPDPDPQLVACPCTMIEQDESCPIGYPSLICGVCKGVGHTTQDKITALAVEMLKVASELGETEDPFAAWEGLQSTPSSAEAMRKVLVRIRDSESFAYSGDDLRSWADEALRAAIHPDREPQPVAWRLEDRCYPGWFTYYDPSHEPPKGAVPVYVTPSIAGDESEHSAELRVAVALWRHNAESGTPASVAMGRTIESFADMLNQDDQERWLLKARAALRAIGWGK